MTKFIYGYFLVFFWCGFAPNILFAQDIHFSQFHNSPANLNPALTGVFSGDYRWIGNYRSQWQSVPVDYLTFSGAYDMKIAIPKLKNGLLSGGVVFNTDQAGDANFSLIQLALNASYTQQLNPAHFLTIGVQLGTMQQSFSPELLTFDEQWNGDVWDENILVTENFNATSIGFGDLSTGVNWHYIGEEIVSDVGISLAHLTQPKFSFFDDITAVLESKWNFYAIGTHMLHEKIGYAPRLLLSLQDAHVEGVVGVGVVYFLHQSKVNEIGIQPAIHYRFNDDFAGDAIIPMLELLYQSWRVGISYDVNISDFTAATNRQGGVEVSVQYIIKKVAPPEVFKACPIF